MKEMIEFRIPRAHYEALLPSMPELRRYAADNSTYLVPLQFWDSLSDAEKFYSLYKSLFGEGPGFPYQKRKYTAQELADASILVMFVWSLVEMAGREYGTVYDESTACPVCNTGARQTSDLILDLAKMPRQDMVMTLAGEYVISRRFRGLLEREKFSGVKFGPVQSSRTGADSQKWSQLLITRRIRLSSQTRFGIDPFDPDVVGKYRCERCGLLGARRISQAFVMKESYDGSDFANSEGCVGVRLGLYEPWPLTVVSPRAYRVMKTHGVSGVGFEVAHIV